MTISKYPLQKALGKVIRRARNSCALSQEDFAGKIGLHRTYVGSIERGERNISLKNIELISHGLQLQPSELLMKAEAVALKSKST